jgi:rod shape determining protein RodA
VGFAIVQPSELAKITIILTASDFFARNKHRIHEIGTIIQSTIIPAGLVLFIILQPDLSTSIVVVVIWTALLFASGLQMKHLLMFAGLGLLMPIIGFPFMERYQQQRVVNFLFPDPNARFGEIYNVNQARITIGTGGWLGQGYGQGTQVQLRFLKARHSDFIFSVISAEFGFVGTVIVMLLLLFLVYRILRAARLAHDAYGALICYGVATLIGFQAMVNIAVNLNLIPVTGLPLPFISQGGSSLMSLMLGIGLVESVVVRHKMLDF